MGTAANGWFPSFRLAARACYGRICSDTHQQERDAGLTPNDILQDTRVARVRELKGEVARLKAELVAIRQDCDIWRTRFSEALAAMRDTDRLPPDGSILILDGWNIVFNSKFKSDGDLHLGKQHLIDAVRTYSQNNLSKFMWLVFDGEDANAIAKGNFRISYTGGTGEQRADRMICDYIRALRFEGNATPVTVVTYDKDFGRKVAALGAAICPVKDFIDGL